jgi:hypothetical protein
MATTTTPRTPGRVGPGGRPPGPPRAPDGSPPPRSPRTRPLDAPRHTRPVARPTAEPALRPPARRELDRRELARRELGRPKLGRARPRHPRAPFILLLIGLLGGALVCLLVISTTLAEGSYQITGLQQQNASLAKQEQLLTQQVAEDSSPEQIAQEAEELGMRPNPNLQFINTKTGKVVAGHPSAADTQIDVPGYTP